MNYKIRFLCNRWNRCNECGKFIAFKDFENGSAKRELITPDSEYTKEEYSTVCSKCNKEKENG